MVKHLFKLIWNKRGQNFLLLSEILISFCVIFALFSFLTFYYQNYRTPLGFNYKQVWAISYDNSQLTKNSDSLSIIYENLQKSLKSMPQIEEVSYAGGNYPYSSMTTMGLNKFNGKEFDRTLIFKVDDYNLKVWNMQLIQGRWFTKEDAIAKNKPVLLNQTLARDMFGNESAIGKIIGDYDDKEKFKVIGVVQDIKTKGDFWPAGRVVFNRLDTADLKNTSTILIKVRPNTTATFESQLYKFMTSTIRDANIEIAHVSDMRDAKNKITIIPMIIFSIIAFFLIVNVALGLFGVLWYTINQRKTEIGLRRAIGASGNAVSYQLVLETLILATLSLMVGCFFAIQFPLLNVLDVSASVYIIAMLLSILFIYLLVFACALYPGKQAAAIHPAIALHEE